MTFAVRETASLGIRVDSTLRALSSLGGLRGAPEVPPLCRETSVSRTANFGTVGKNGLRFDSNQDIGGDIDLPEAFLKLMGLQ